MEKLVKSLSWSKISMWLKNRKQFIKTYFEKEDFFETKEILFWKCLWKVIEEWEFENEDYIVLSCLEDFNWEIILDKRKEKLLRQAFKNIKKYADIFQDLQFDLLPVYEHKLQEFIDGVCVLGYVDNTNKELTKIKEFKTWKKPWTQEDVDENGQLDIYCLLIYITKWYLPEDVELIWFETRDNEKWEIDLTWRIERFKYDVEKNKERILLWKEKIPEIFEVIQKEQLAWEKRKWKEDLFDKNLLHKLYELEIEKKSIELRQTELKEQIQKNLELNKLEDYKLEWVWSVFYTTRKKYEYSQEILDLEKNYKDAKKEFEKKAKPEITKSLSFRF